MKYSLNTSFHQAYNNDSTVGKFDLHSHIETTGFFDNGLDLYKAILSSLLESLEVYEEGQFYGKQ